MNTDRAAVLAETLTEYRRNRHAIRAVEIESDCCPTCSLDTNREFSLDAVPLLPHAYCTNPAGCSCSYSPIALQAPAVAEQVPVLEPVPLLVPEPAVEPERSHTDLSPVIVAPPSGVPAYLKTPAAAMIAVGVIVVAFGIGAINRTSRTNDSTVSEFGTPPQMVTSQPVPAASPRAKSQAAPKAATLPDWQPMPKAQPRASTPTRAAPVATYAGNYQRDRELEAKAARDIRELEAIAINNEAARRAQEVAAQQQAYLRNLFSRQVQMPQPTGINVTRLNRDRVATVTDNATAEDSVAP